MIAAREPVHKESQRFFHKEHKEEHQNEIIVLYLTTVEIYIFELQL